jgi:hypothetical protein
MKARNVTLVLAGPALALALSLTPFLGCGGGGGGNPTPTVRDSGTDSTASHPDTGSGSDASGNNDAAHETSIPDTGSCVSESSACNTCYTDAQAATDPYNACSQYTKNCVPVTLTVPSHPPL